MNKLYFYPQIDLFLMNMCRIRDSEDDRHPFVAIHKEFGEEYWIVDSVAGNDRETLAIGFSLWNTAFDFAKAICREYELPCYVFKLDGTIRKKYEYKKHKNASVARRQKAPRKY